MTHDNNNPELSSAASSEVVCGLHFAIIPTTPYNLLTLKLSICCLLSPYNRPIQHIAFIFLVPIGL